MPNSNSTYFKKHANDSILQNILFKTDKTSMFKLYYLLWGRGVGLCNQFWMQKNYDFHSSYLNHTTYWNSGTRGPIALSSWIWQFRNKSYVKISKHFTLRVLSNKWGEPTASYIWTGWVWEITSWSPRLQEITDHLRGIYGIYLKINKEKPINHNMELVGLRNTRILADYAQKSPWRLV